MKYEKQTNGTCVDKTRKQLMKSQSEIDKITQSIRERKDHTDDWITE
jgi:peptidoglycan hydrolase CwlO-like protein